MSLNIPAATTGTTNINQTHLSDIQGNSALNPVLEINGGSYLVSGKESTDPFPINSTAEPAAPLNAGTEGGQKKSAQYRVTQCSDHPGNEDDMKITPLMAADRGGNTEIVRDRLRQGTVLNTLGIAPFVLAASDAGVSDTDLAKCLLEAMLILDILKALDATR